ncbi:hypothetical protein BU15DRAFT_81236 [Melanogaster broomeanus]|nr:hypothetical protein BU15DRAFT_81236 [Melanogaster broomeanus]
MLFQSPSTCPHRLAARLRLHHLLVSSSRLASTSSKFPFPSARNATPHQIFHLPNGASQEQIKARCKAFSQCRRPSADRSPAFTPTPTFHSALARTISPEQRTVRFQAITKAYGILRGRVPAPGPGARHSADDDIIRAELRRRRPSKQTYDGRTRPGFSDSAWGWEDGGGGFAGTRASEMEQTPRSRWEEGLNYAPIAAVVIVTIAAVGLRSFHAQQVEHHTQTAAANLAQARADAQEFGMERRKQIRERVREAKQREAAGAETEERVPVGTQDSRGGDERISG